MAAFNVAVFSAKEYDQNWLNRFKPNDIHYRFISDNLTDHTAILANGCDAICAFVNDDLDESVLTQLNDLGINTIALRCAGFNNVNIEAAKSLKFNIARVPSYSPEAVAEHTFGLILTLNRKLHKAYNRTKEDNFSLQGLQGFNLHGKTIGLIGTGKIGLATARIAKGFGMNILACDPNPDNELTQMGGQYTQLNELISKSDIISLHCPLSENTHHIINQQQVETMKDGVMLINTSRGGLVNTQSVINGLKSGKIGYLGLDVYEQESELFFEDMSNQVIQDDVFQRLLTFHNVLITGHQGFFTEEALSQISKTTADNLTQMLTNNTCANLIY